MICCHQFVLYCHRREEVRFVAIILCSIITQGKKKYDLLPPLCARLSQKGRSTSCCQQFVIDCHKREEIRFVVANLCSIVTEKKKYDLLPAICVRLSQKGRSTVCATNLCLIVTEGKKYEEVRFVATNFCSIVTKGKKFDLLSPICARLSQKRKKIRLFASNHRREEIANLCRLSQERRSTICCHHFVLDCQRREEI